MCSARLVCLLEAIDYLLEIIDNVRKVGANEQSGDDCARVNDIDLLLREFTTLEFMPLVADIGHVLPRLVRLACTVFVKLITFRFSVPAC